MKRTFLIAGNWKMNAGPSEASKIATELVAAWEGKSFQAEALICPPFVSIPAVAAAFGNSAFKTGAQNVHTEDNGAFTGEVSTDMLKETGCEYVIVGHSERREYFHESSDLVAEKAKKVINDGLKAIVCVGEVLSERKAGTYKEVVKEQMNAVLNTLSGDVSDQFVVAYEPVWAIGTGETATPEQAQDMHQYIRTLLNEHFGSEVAEKIRILYGGSMKPDNAADLLSRPDVDGGLIGGASLKADSFSEILSAAESI
ncbi:MAG: triose-phosphate isomerase [Balneolaceae bacterium]|nr:MAG: triose-phosphate isomerase [Balneolaceae bacterium]